MRARVVHVDSLGQLPIAGSANSSHGAPSGEHIALPSRLFRFLRLCTSRLSPRRVTFAALGRFQMLACSCLVPIRFLCPRGPSDGSCQLGKYACDSMVQGRFSSMMARGLTWSASTRKHHRWLAMPVSIDDLSTDASDLRTQDVFGASGSCSLQGLGHVMSNSWMAIQ